jgi:hypothetical protein
VTRLNLVVDDGGGARATSKSQLANSIFDITGKIGSKENCYIITFHL